MRNFKSERLNQFPTSCKKIGWDFLLNQADPKAMPQCLPLAKFRQINLSNFLLGQGECPPEVRKGRYNWKSWCFTQISSCVIVTQSCLTLRDPMDCSLPGYSVHVIFPNKHTGAGCHFLLQRIFPTPGSNLCFFHLRHWQVGSLPLAPPGATGTTSLHMQWVSVLEVATTPLANDCQV